MALLITASAPLFAQTPAAPRVTVGAGVKSLRIDWQPASGAARYELWQRAHSTSAWAKAADYPATATNAIVRVSVHTLDWPGASYRVAACNSAGCTNSSDVPVASLRLQAPGYFKSSQPEIAESFGGNVDVAAGAVYMVAAAPNDDVNGVRNAGAAYVFRRSSDATNWSQRTRLLPGVVQADGGAGMRVAISTDGNTVAVGLPNIFHAATDPNSGEVYVFRNTSTGWQRTRIETGRRGSFGNWVSLDDSGTVLAAGRDSGADVFILANGAWAVRRHIEDRTAPEDNCPNGSLSGDGRLLAETCFNGSVTTPSRSFLRIHPSYSQSRRDLDLPGSGSGSSEDRRFGISVDYSGDWIATQNFAGRLEVDIFQRVSGWHQFQARVSPGTWQGSRRTLFGQGIALSSDGLALAVGDPVDIGAGAGVQRGTLAAGSAATGAVYVFRRSGAAWSRQSVVKPNYLLGPGGAAAQTFGSAVSLSQSGSTLAVAQPAESSDAVGIDGAWDNTRRAQSGAVWLY
jgi:hypothetical protein